MKTANSLIVVTALFFLSRGVVLAAETQYNPSAIYQVRTVPEGSKTSVNHESEPSESDDNLSYTKPTTEAHPDISGTAEVSEAGHEGKPNIADLTVGAVLAKQEADKSFFESLTEAFITTVVIPVETGIHKSEEVLLKALTLAKSSLSSFYTNLQSQVYTSSYKAVISLSKSLNSFISSVSHAVSSTHSSISAHVPHKLKVAGILLVMATPFLLGLAAKTSFGKQMAFIGSAVLSVGDLLVHGLSAGAAVIQSLTSSLSYQQAYAENKSWFQRKTGRDIGAPGHDVLYGGGLILVALTLFYAPAIGAKAGQMSTTITPYIQAIAAPVSAYATNQGTKVVEETTRECQIPGQCDTKLDFAITLGVNTLAQGIPIEGPAIALKKSLNVGEEVLDEGTTLSKITSSSGDELADGGSSIGKALNKANDIQLNPHIRLTNQALETRLKKDFIQKHFGSVDSPSFKQALEKYPNAMRLIDENNGHIIRYHLTDEAFQIRRSSKINVASNFNSVDDMLESAEKALTDKENIAEINKWFSDASNYETIRVSKNLGRVIGKNYVLKEGKLVISESEQVIIELKKIGDELIINSGFPTYKYE